MPGSCCAVFGCCHRGGHTFPKDKKIRNQWRRAIKRDSFKPIRPWWPTASSLVCKAHFLDSDYEEKSVLGFKVNKKKLKKTAVPSQFAWSKVEPSSPALSREKRLKERNEKRRLEKEEVKQDECRKGESAENDAVVQDLNLAMQVDIESVPVIQEVHIQTDPLPNYSTCTSETQTESNRGFTIEDFKTDSAGVHYYTGLQDYLTFSDVLASLGPSAFKLTYLHGVRPSICVPDQFFLTVIKCRRYTPNFELSRMFKISESEVYCIFVTWMRFMSLQWREVDIWPSRDCVSFYAPSDFKRNFPTTRTILDGFEFPVKKPKAPTAQQVTFSTYKNRNTAKSVLGVTPGGLVSYMSCAYGGSTSDRQIAERSGLTRRTDPGDAIMVDKGFDIQDTFAPVDVTINIPTFFRKKNRMSGKSVLRDRKISSKRVHVERIIGLGKTYKILTQPLNQTEMTLASNIAFVCFMLLNFRKCIIPSSA
ncbi:uncharacterized protein LOC119721789 [Patiria miniata]|uniref:THAP-type domain-containing protein n=1 Tax=Patiria miniata TaxID=46514 RepID=A0A913Z9W2_PATMI|nr:uncharacterized protein LOC119721789 [Patiria miniata]